MGYIAIVAYITLSLSVKETTYATRKHFLFGFKSSFPSQENQSTEFYIFKFHDVIKCLRVKQENILLNNLGSKHVL